MVLASLVSASLLGLASGFAIPMSNGFPAPNMTGLRAIGQEAGGLLPNGPLPTELGPNSVTAFQLIAANEIFESAYFNNLLQNITNRVDGYTTGNQTRLESIVRAITAQEQLHALAATAALNGSGNFAPGPCQYMSPATTLNESIGLAETFTAVVLGALQGANVLFAQDGLDVPVRLISSVIGQEGEQVGYFRYYMGQIPSESPFLTYVPAPLAYSALQMFTVPGSCPYPTSMINLTITPPIMTNGMPIAYLPPQDTTLQFTVSMANGTTSGVNGTSSSGNGTSSGSGMFMTYQTGQQLPISVPVQNMQTNGSMMSFSANFPYSRYVMQGFSHGALTTQSNFSDGDAVAANAIAGPAVIQVMNPL